MRLWEVVLALWVVLRPAAGEQPLLLAITDNAFIDECVRVHNDFRSKVQPEASNMQYMVGAGLGCTCGSRPPPAAVGQWAGGSFLAVGEAANLESLVCVQMASHSFDRRYSESVVDR